METPRRSARILKRTQVSLENGRGFSVVEKTMVEHGPYFKNYVYFLESLIPLVSWILSFIFIVYYFLKKYIKVVVLGSILFGIFFTKDKLFSLVPNIKPLDPLEAQLPLEAQDLIQSEELLLESQDVEDYYPQLAVSPLQESPQEGNERHEDLKELREKVDNISLVLKDLNGMEWRKYVKEEIGIEIQKLNILEKEQVQDMIDARLQRDERIDYALRSRGARVIEASRDFRSGLKSKWLKLFFPTVQRESINKVHQVLESRKSPGDCWAMSGSKGFVDIGLSQKIIPSSVVIHHASLQELSGFKTAPKRIQVYSRNTLLGNGTFDPRDKDSSVLFLKKISNPIDSVRVQVLSNWGHQDYTCLYQIQVFS